MSIDALRRDYDGRPLDPSEVGDPLAFFQTWFAEALDAVGVDAHTMALASVDAAGQPSLRYVLLRACDAAGLGFFTHFDSRKGRELAAHPLAALAFHWPALDRQVRAEGPVEVLPREAVEHYFATRPRGSRLAAAVSQQSAVIASRRQLEEAVDTLDARLAGAEPPCPARWGGFRLQPQSWEFWQGRRNRLHDRVRCRQVDGRWLSERLAP